MKQDANTRDCKLRSDKCATSLTGDCASQALGTPKPDAHDRVKLSSHSACLDADPADMHITAVDATNISEEMFLGVQKLQANTDASDRKIEGDQQNDNPDEGIFGNSLNASELEASTETRKLWGCHAIQAAICLLRSQIQARPETRE